MKFQNIWDLIGLQGEKEMRYRRSAIRMVVRLVDSNTGN
jgi:hypothetical protein